MNTKTIRRSAALVLTSVAFVFTAAQLPARAANADLVVRNLSFFPDPAEASMDIHIKFDVVNKGPGTAPASRARLTISGNPSLVFYCSVPILAANQKHHCSHPGGLLHQRSHQWLAAPGAPGDYGTQAVADYDQVVSEGTAGEGNNVTSLVMKVRR